MLIMTQNKKNLINLDSLGSMFLSSCYGRYNGGRVRVLASYPLSEDVTEILGEYENEARAMDVLEEIATEYTNYMKVDGGFNPFTNAQTQAFAFNHPKVYRMPDM